MDGLAGWQLRDPGWSHSCVCKLAGYWPGICLLSAGVPWFFSVGTLDFQQASLCLFTGLSQGFKRGKIKATRPLKPRLGSDIFYSSNLLLDGRCFAAKIVVIYS